MAQISTGKARDDVADFHRTSGELALLLSKAVQENLKILRRVYRGGKVGL